MALFKYNEQKLAFERTNKLLKYRMIVGILFLSVFLLAAKKSKKEYIPTEVTITQENYQRTVFEMVDNLPFEHKSILKAQALLESSHFKSPVFKENNNVFGMRLAKQRLTFATGTNLKHATYKTVEDAVLDRLIYDARYLHGLTEQEYYNYLDRVYAEGGNYSQTLKQIIKQNKLK
jgi:hypothetical protein